MEFTVWLQNDEKGIASKYTSSVSSLSFSLFFHKISFLGNMGLPVNFVMAWVGLDQIPAVTTG